MYLFDLPIWLGATHVSCALVAADLHPQLDPTHLSVVRCPAGWQPPTLPSGVFVGVVASPDEVTVVAPHTESSAIGRANPNEGIRPIVGYIIALAVGLIVVASVPWISIGFLRK